ncbi:MAG: ethylbenzene dehydrogenase-related protein [Candidatus Methylomirabilales bacterium]
MKVAWRGVLAAAVLVAFSLALLVAMPSAQQAPQRLTAKRAPGAPVLDGVMEDVWKSATPLTVKLAGGRNLAGGTTEVTLRAMHTADTLYFLMEYKDPTQSFVRGPWEKQADGSWKKLRDPNDKGGDNNLYYEDKMAMLWNISSPAFEARGCFSACHIGEGKPYGNKYTANPGERLDMWHWKSVRTGPVGQIDDQYVDSTRYDPEKAPEAGRKADPKTGGGYADNQTQDKSRPMWALPENKPAPPYWILDNQKMQLDDSKYKAGDKVPGILISALAGDRGDLPMRANWKDGTWTLEFSRKLTTGSEFDVQFNDLKKEYAFGVAVFDNAQVRHAFHGGVLKLGFEQ